MPPPSPSRARPDPTLLGLDAALLRLRRLWDAPTGVLHRGAVVDGSTLLLCLVLSEIEHRPAVPGTPAPDQGPDAEPGVVEVATGLGVTQSTASRLASRAVDSGMVDRHRSTRDPRRAALTLTPDGADLVEASRQHRARALGQCLADWSEDDRVALAALVSRFADAVTGDRAAGSVSAQPWSRRPPVREPASLSDGVARPRCRRPAPPRRPPGTGTRWARSGCAGPGRGSPAGSRRR